jgi:L-rhamnose-H+ transport protein
MGSNPLVGVLFHWLGGLASASFYLPYRGVRKWSWETYWLVGGLFSWIVAPWTFAFLLVPNLISVLASAPPSSIAWAYFFGLLWGVGGLTFGLTLRYLGIALGMAVALGYCAAFGTLLPPIFDGTFVSLLVSSSGRMILLGVLVCLAGIAVSGMAGMSKERELTGDEKKAVIKEFDFRKGMLVATVAGILSACMAYGLAAGIPIAESAKSQLLASGGSDLWQNLPVLIVVLLGGFTTNFLWCIRLNLRNKSGHEYVLIVPDAEEVGAPTPSLLRNYVFSALAGVIWYLQFFFYSMGTVRMGAYHFSSWTLHMASIIIFSTLWGIALKEWKGVGRRTWILLLTGLVVLIASTAIVGYGNFIKAQTPG